MSTILIYNLLNAYAYYPLFDPILYFDIPTIDSTKEINISV
jgi:hypothetical protein